MDRKGYILKKTKFLAVGDADILTYTQNAFFFLWRTCDSGLGMISTSAVPPLREVVDVKCIIDLQHEEDWYFQFQCGMSNRKKSTGQTAICGRDHFSVHSSTAVCEIHHRPASTEDLIQLQPVSSLIPSQSSNLS